MIDYRWTGTDAESRVRTADRFFDRAGRPISLVEWAIKRRDRDYCRIGFWEGEGGAWVYTFWLGLDVSFGIGAEPAIFDTHVSAFGCQPHLAWACPTDNESHARALHDRVALYVEDGITPPGWNFDQILCAPIQSVPIVSDQNRSLEGRGPFGQD